MKKFSVLKYQVAANTKQTAPLEILIELPNPIITDMVFITRAASSLWVENSAGVSISDNVALRVPSDGLDQQLTTNNIPSLPLSGLAPFEINNLDLEISGPPYTIKCSFFNRDAVNIVYGNILFVTKEKDKEIIKIDPD